MDEKGYLKFQCNWSKSGPVEEGIIKDINSWRTKLYQKGWIGAFPNGIGYGNISIRIVGNIFLITGTETGKFENLTNEHYSKVVAYNLEKNAITCIGPVKASSESLSHAAIYAKNLMVNAIIHIHDKKLWESLKKDNPTTAADIEYGTPEMAKEIIRLFKETNLAEKKIIVMGGHENGIICFGNTMNEAGEILMRLSSVEK
jgi:L-ribulose-5-phosphate 4-epimerase